MTEPTATEPTEPGPTPDEVTGTPALPSSNADYTVSYENKRVTLQGGQSRYLDLDQPRVNADANQYDVRSLVSTTSGPKLVFNTDSVATAKSAATQPEECADKIQLAPASTSIDISQDLVICAVTNGIGAVNEPARTKMARIVVNSVADDGTANLTITTWEIPS